MQNTCMFGFETTSLFLFSTQSPLMTLRRITVLYFYSLNLIASSEMPLQSYSQLVRSDECIDAPAITSALLVRCDECIDAPAITRTLMTIRSTLDSPHPSCHFPWQVPSPCPATL